ncbi:MAG: NADP-dependent oxidoreductase [Massilia sp.]|nr:NADP-dependent oxidoreductase [Massilia sp.]
MIDTGPSTGTMRGWAIGGYGDPMRLMDDLPVPKPGPRDVLIRMHGAEVGDWDEMVRIGAWDMERPFPLVLGLAGAGTVAAVGKDADQFGVTLPVYAYSYPLYDNGAWAEYMLVPEHYVARATTALTLVEAGGIPTIGLTAHETITDLLDVRADEVVVISAAAGGVGHLAVQIAALRGAHVVATAGPNNQKFLASLGAETVFDYTEVDDMAKAVRARYPGGADKVLNGVAGEAANDYVWTLKDGGKMVDLPGAVTVERPGVDIISDYVVRGNGARLAKLTRLFDSGSLRLEIQAVEAFVDASSALDLVLGKHVRGKVILRIV